MNWKLNYKGKALVISSGLIYFNKKKPKGLYLQDILEMIEAEPEKSYYHKAIEGKVTLSKAVEFNETDKLGKNREYYSAINLYDLKPEREFEELPRTGEELLSKHYKSSPRNLIEKE